MHKRSLFFILILFLILFSTSFVCASETLTHENTNGKMTLSVEIDSIDDEGLNDVNSDSISLSSDSTLDQVDDAQNSDGIENESCLTFDEKTPVLGVSNDEPILGAEIHANTQGWTTAGQVMEAIFRAAPGDIIYLDGKTFTGTSGRPWGASGSLNGITVYGGSYAGDTAMAKFDNEGYTLNFGNTQMNGVKFENINFRNSMFWFDGGSTMTDCVFNNLQCSQQGICFVGDGNARRQYRITNTKFTNLHHIYDPDVAQGGFSEFDDGHGQLIAAFGIRMDHCTFENTSSTHHGGAICIADESRWGSRVVPSELYYTDFINVTSKWFAVYIHANFSDSGDSHIYSPEIVDHCNFINCTATEEYGAALGISHDDLIVRDSKFISNTGGQGAAIMIGGLTNEKGTIDDTAFNGRNTKGNNITILRCDFKDNVVSAHETAFPTSPGSSGNAGAIYVFGNDTKILDSTFDNNVAGSGCGAAIYVVGERTNITGCEFTNHGSVNGTVYIKGNDAKIYDSTFTDNTAVNGAGVYILGKNTDISHSTFDSNNATNGGAVYINGDSTRLVDNKFNKNTVNNQGGAVFIQGDSSWVSQNTFTANEAVPQDNSSSGTTGLGGAFYVEGDNTMSGDNVFTHNKARNGSAIYSTGNNFNLYYDSFNENQAWSYLLIVTPDPEESYYNTSDVNVTICHVGGDNIINAIHNAASPDQIHFHSVTYKHSNGNVITTGEDETPVAGAENSRDGTITYQDDRENLQKINIIKIVCDEDGEVIFGPDYVDYTNITGEIRVTLKKPIKKGHYTVYAEHPEDWNYKAISNIGKFEILGLVDLSTEKTSDKTEYYVGETVTWTITVHNANNASRADNITLKDVLPSEVTFVSATATNGTYDSATNTWTIKNMTNGSSATLTIVTTAIKDGNNVINSASVSCDDKDWNLSNNDANATIKIKPLADLQVIKIVSNATAHKGETVVWTITVRNNGPSKAENVRVNDVIPTELTYTDSDVDVSQGSFTNGIWTIGDMENGDEFTLTINTVIGVTNDNITNVAVVESDTYDPNLTNNEDNDTVEIPPEADLSVVKEASVEKAHIGDTVTWIVTVTNNGPDTAKDAYVSDVIPGELSDVVVSVSKGSFSNGVWTIGDMENGDTVVMTVVSVVSVSNVNITNVALVNSSTYDPNETNNKDNDTVEIPPEADLSVVKEVDVGKVHLGDVVIWTITVTNKGPDSAVDAYVDDVIPSELTGAAVVSVSKGSFVGSKWTIGNLTNG